MVLLETGQECPDLVEPSGQARFIFLSPDEFIFQVSAVLPDVKTILGIQFIHLVQEWFFVAVAWTYLLVYIEVYHLMYQHIPEILLSVADIPCYQDFPSHLAVSFADIEDAHGGLSPIGGQLWFHQFSLEIHLVVFIEQVFQYVSCNFHHLAAMMSGFFGYHSEIVPNLREIFGEIFQETLHLVGGVTREGKALFGEVTFDGFLHQCRLRIALL